jgi:hypothetical protein
MAEQLSENSRQGFATRNPLCSGHETDLSRNLCWESGHVYDETPVGIAVYVRNDPVNLIDPDGRTSLSFEWGYLIQLGWGEGEALEYAERLPYVNASAGKRPIPLIPITLISRPVLMPFIIIRV